VSFYNNADWNQPFTIVSGGSPVDLTGKTLRWTLRAQLSDATPLVEGTTQDILTVTDGPAGKFTLVVPYSTTRDVPAGNHYWDLIDVLGAGSQTRIAGGRFLVRQGVSA